MVHSIKIWLPDNIDCEALFNSVETVFNQNNFRIVRNNNKLVFERMTSKRGADKFQILVELFKAFTRGTIYIGGESNRELICKINYLKQLIVSMILGLIISAIFSMITGDLLTTLLWMCIPITIICMAIGIMTGNSQIEELLRNAIEFPKAQKSVL